MHAGLMESSVEASDSIERVQRMLGGVPRYTLGYFSSSRGFFSGIAQIPGEDGGAMVPLQSGKAYPIESEWVQKPSKIAQSGARFILVVEKEAIFSRLVEDNFATRKGGECLMLTGCGQPDLATRAFLKECCSAHSPDLPVLGLVDCNPYGLGILLTYSHGSKAHPEANAWTIPQLHWLGLRGSDVEEQSLPRSSLQCLTDSDVSRLGGLQRNPYILASEELTGEVSFWGEQGVKCEIEALLSRGLDFLADTFLPLKLGVDRQPPTGPLKMNFIDALPLTPPPFPMEERRGGGGGGGGEEMVGEEEWWL